MSELRTILLVDMDYFFVACEEIRHPELKGKPTIVGADPKGGNGRGVVMTCNYAARKFGIHSAMPISTAYRLKPDANFLLMDYPFYEKKSGEVIDVLRSYSEKLEQVSIDEAFVDISALVSNYDEAMKCAEKIKREILSKTSLPCTIGVSYNKLMAKMACDAGKPDGVRAITEDEARNFLSKVPIEKIYGIGDKTRERLEKIGIKTTDELAKANKMTLMTEFGKFGLDIHNYANGIDESELVYSSEVQSISRESTFEKDTKDEKLVVEKFEELAKEVMGEVKKQDLSFNNVTIKIRYSDFSEHLKSKTVRTSNEIGAILDAAIPLYKKYVDKEKKVRKLGVRVSGLVKSRSQKRLFV